MSKLGPLLFLLLTPFGCKDGAPSNTAVQTKKTAKPPKVGAAPPAATKKSANPTPSKCGSYEVDVKLPPRFLCKTDADCGWTPHRPGVCAQPLCTHHYRAGTKQWVEAANALHRRVCGGKRYPSCVRVKCLHSKPEGAECRQNRCALRLGTAKGR